jgi:Zn-dependent peptidase ImmA (M78 family)
VFAAPFRAPHLVALTAKERASDLAAVIVNASSTTHRRVDLAHELAHVLFDETVDEVGYWLDLEAHREADASRSEQRARAFAAELLIPRRGLAELVGHAHEHVEARSSLAASMDLTRRVGHHFHASPELTTNHLVNNGYISDALREEVSRAVTIPPFPASPRRPMLHRRLAEALEAGLITQMRAREMLGISARDPLPADVEPGP